LGRRATRGRKRGYAAAKNIFHYWFHTGEAHAVRQMLGHGNLPQFVGNMESVFYRPGEM